MADAIRISQRRVLLRDPHDCTDAADELTLYHAVFDTLVKRAGQGFVPHLAAAWTVSPDCRTWLFRLRAGVRFHDGTVCDGAAVVASLMRMARADKGYTLGAPGVWRQYLGAAQVTAPDALTVRVVLPEPLADLLDILEQGFIVAPSALADLDAGRMDRPVGSGPYRVVGVSEGEVVAERVAEHFAPGAHGRIAWCAEPDAARRLALLESGAVQVANDLVPSVPLGAGLTRLDYMSPVAIIYLLNAAQGPLADARVRHAISLGVDRARLIADVLEGHARPLTGFVSPAHYGAGEDAGALFDSERARALLAQAGFADGLTLAVDCPTRLPDEAERLTQALAGQLADIGIALRVTRHEDREAYAHMVRRKEIGDICVFDSSPMSTFRVLYEKIDSRVAGSWWQGYANRVVERLLDVARAEPDRDARAAIYARAYGEMQTDPAWLTLYNPTRVIGLRGAHPGFAMPVDGVIDVTDLPGALA